MKTDDDMVLDVDAIVTYMKTVVNVTSPAMRTFYCFYFTWGTGPLPRGRGDKWYVSPEEYPGQGFPKYCHGLGYLLTPDLVTDLYNISQYTRTFWIDDVHISGFLPRNLGGVTFVQLPNQSPYFSRGVPPEEVLLRKKWLLHTFSQPWHFDSYWQAFQARWNATIRAHFQGVVYQRTNKTLADEVFAIT